MNPFDGYIKPGQHPKRPWWRDPGPSYGNRAGVYTITYRVDGRTLESTDVYFPSFGYSPEEREGWAAAVEEAMVEIDRIAPLAPPAPRCGQVWGFPDQNYQQVVSVLGGTAFLGRTGPLECLTWPPPNAVLVEGHGAPWAPPGWKP